MAETGEPLKLTGRQVTSSRYARSVINWVHSLLGLTLLFVVGVNFLNAISRYLFGISPVGADELMVYVVIWAVTIASILSLIMRSHINVNLLPLYAKGRAHHLLHVLHAAAAVLACGYATYASWLFIGQISKLGVKSMGLGLPMVIPHGALLVGFAGMTLAGAVMLVRDLLAMARNAPYSEVEP